MNWRFFAFYSAIGILSSFPIACGIFLGGLTERGDYVGAFIWGVLAVIASVVNVDIYLKAVQRTINEMERHKNTLDEFKAFLDKAGGK